jgi:hypothetical protein
MRGGATRLPLQWISDVPEIHPSPNAQVGNTRLALGEGGEGLRATQVKCGRHRAVRQVTVYGAFGAPPHPNPLPNGERGLAALGTTAPTPLPPGKRDGIASVS